MLTCREIAQELSSGTYDQKGWWFKLKLRFHALVCPPCRTYADQLRSISEGVQDMARHQEPSPEKLAAMQKRCLHKLCSKDEALSSKPDS